MNLSELISKLSQIYREQGDLMVFIEAKDIMVKMEPYHLLSDDISVVIGWG